MNPIAPPGSQAEQVGRLIIAAVLVTSLPQLPLGNYLIYPFTILTTWFHEMGHGLAGLLLGQGFERLVILPDGSGYAESSLNADSGIITRALIAAGGPIAPILFGSGLILASSRQRFWQPALVGLALLLALSVLIWVRSPVGLVVLPVLAAALACIAIKGRDWVRQFTLQLIGVISALSLLRDWDYLFSYSAVIGGHVMLSDTGAMQDALWLPYWLWAIVLIAISVLTIGASLKIALREGSPRFRRH